MFNIEIPIDQTTLAGYEKFIQCKRLPKYQVRGSKILTDENSFNLVFGKDDNRSLSVDNSKLFDYQEHVINTALHVKRYAAFLDCGLGKTLIMLNWAKTISERVGKVLILCPLAVIQEFYNDAEKFGLDVRIVNLRNQKTWDEGIAILNSESLRDIDMEGVKGIALDESSILKNADGITKKWLVDIAKSIEYKIACSATPAPNDQSEYASHATFLEYAASEKEFYSRFFRKIGTKWHLKAHAIEKFYEHLKTWACYIHNPNVLGFECGGYLDHQPDYIRMHCEGGTDFLNGLLFSTTTGLKDAQKIYRYRSDKSTERFKKCIEKASEHKSIVWCSRNAEEEAFRQEIPNCKLITGQTPIEKRIEIIDSWRSGEIQTIVSKPKILGWGVNMQQASAHIYSGYDFSMESFYQAVRRSHRYGREGRLKVYIPMIEAERPIFQTIDRKLKTFEEDVIHLQGKFFK